MVKARCQRCGGESEGKSDKEAKMSIDHSVGLSRGKPCPGFPQAPIVIVASKTSEKAPEPKPVETPKEEPKAESKADSPKPTKKSKSSKKK